jgi:hypothetical protein
MSFATPSDGSVSSRPAAAADGPGHHGGRIGRSVGVSLRLTFGALVGGALGLYGGAWAGLILGAIIPGDLGEYLMIVLLGCVIGGAGGAYLGGKGVLRILRLIKAERRSLRHGRT